MNIFTSKLNAFFKRFFVSRLEEVPFIVFISFLTTFVVARSYVYLTQKDFLAHPLFIEAIRFKGIHVHHLNFGIVILAISGFIALYDLRPHIHRMTAILYGVGLALTFDEFALWFFLEDVYWARITYDVILVITLIFLNIIYFPSFWRRQGRFIKRFIRTVRTKIVSDRSSS